MTHVYNGKRKGISLVEMTIAVILFGVLSTIALIYYKSLFNIDLTAKKARIAALMNQGYQLSGAYDIYTVQYGVRPTNILELNETNRLVLTDLPAIIREMSSTGWELNITTGIASGNAFKFPIDLNGTVDLNTTEDDDLYCAIYNHEINSSVELNVTKNVPFLNETASYALYGKTFCYSETIAGVYKHWIMVIK